MTSAQLWAGRSMRSVATFILAAVVLFALGTPQARAAFPNTPDPGIPTTNGVVYAIAVSADRVYLGGTFTTVGGMPRNNIAAINRATGTLDPTFNPNLNSTVRAVAVSGSTVYAGGNFSMVGAGTKAAPGTSVRRNLIAELDGATGTATTFNPNLNGLVYAVAVSGSTVYAGGNFSMVGAGTTAAPGTSVRRNFIAQLDGATGTATAFNPNLNNVVYAVALAVSGSTVYVGGNFTTVGAGTTAVPGTPAARNRIVQLDGATGTATAFDPNLDGVVYAVAVSGSTVYAGGAFTSVGAGTTDNPFVAATRNRIAQLDGATGWATAFDPNADTYVASLAVTGSSVFAQGAFTAIGGASRNGLAQLDATAGTATAFDPGAPQSNFSALATDGPGRVYVGCSCTLNGTAANFARFTDASVATAVTWAGGTARFAARGGVLVAWRTGLESDNLGFDVLRARRGHATRVKLTRKLIAGSALRTSRLSLTYRFSDPAGRPGDRYFVVARDLRGHATIHTVGAAR